MTFTGTGNQTPGTILWAGTVTANCPCTSGTPITVVATCSTDPTCTTTFSTTSPCCCPIFSTSFQPGLCNSGSNPQQQITFNTTVTNNTTCSFHIQRNYGDGTMGSIITIGPGVTTLPPDIHFYNPGAYTAQFTITTTSGGATGCTDNSPVNLSAVCGACATNPTITSLCKALEPITIFLLVLATMLGLLSLAPLCVVSASFAATTAIIGFIFLFLLAGLCSSCICKFIPKILGEYLFVLGIDLFIFTVPNCALGIVFPTTTIAGLAATSTMILGFVILLLWFLFNRVSCALTSCDFWCLIGGVNTPSLANIAIAIAFILAILSPTLVLGAGVAIAVAIAWIAIACVALFFPPCSTSCNNC